MNEINWNDKFLDYFADEDITAALLVLYNQVINISEKLNIISKCQICGKIITREEISIGLVIPSKLPWDAKNALNRWICGKCMSKHDKMCEDKEYYKQWLLEEGYSN